MLPRTPAPHPPPGTSTSGPMASTTTLDTKLPLRVICVESQPFAQNSYLLATGPGQPWLLVDPGFEPEAVIAAAGAFGEPAAVLLTHGHSDHIAGNAAVKSRWPQVPLLIGHAETNKLTDPVANLSHNFGIDVVSPPADRTVAEGDRLSLAGFDLLVHEIPGHSSGHVVFVVRREEAGAGERMLLLAGDVLFRGSVGRTDFPDGDFAALAAGIRSRLYTLPDDTLVLPGHGPTTTIGREKRENPFVAAAAGRPD